MRKEFLRRHARICLLAAAAVLASPAIGLAESTADTIAVNVDQAKLVRLPGKVATIVVGNPLIADVTLQPGGMIVVTGKGYGATNFIGLDPVRSAYPGRRPKRPARDRLSRDRAGVL
jgi:Flp pilus assembly secretin CpaC